MPTASIIEGAKKINSTRENYFYACSDLFLHKKRKQKERNITKSGTNGTKMFCRVNITTKELSSAYSNLDWSEFPKIFWTSMIMLSLQRLAESPKARAEEKYHNWVYNFVLLV